MDVQKIFTPTNLERYSFLWSQARLIIAAIALFLGGYPLAYKLFPFMMMTVSNLLTLCYVISGAASVYLLYRWKQNKKMIFNGKDQKDTIAFFVSIVSSINLGLAGLMSINIGMTISSNKAIFVLVGLAYLASAYHLNQRWNANKQKLF